MVIGLTNSRGNKRGKLSEQAIKNRQSFVSGIKKEFIETESTSLIQDQCHALMPENAGAFKCNKITARISTHRSVMFLMLHFCCLPIELQSANLSPVKKAFI